MFPALKEEMSTFDKIYVEATFPVRTGWLCIPDHFYILINK